VLVVVRINIAGAALSHFSLFHTQLANPNVPLSYRLSLSYFNGPGFEGATVVVDEDCMVDTQSPTKYGLLPHKKLKASTHATLAALISFCNSVKVVRQAAHTPAPVAVLRAAMPPHESKAAADDLRDALLESLEKAGVDTSDAGVGADDASAFYPPARSVSMSSSASSKSPVPPEDPGQQQLAGFSFQPNTKSNPSGRAPPAPLSSPGPNSGKQPARKKSPPPGAKRSATPPARKAATRKRGETSEEESDPMSEDSHLSKSLSEGLPESLCSTTTDEDFEGEVKDSETTKARKMKRKKRRKRFLKKVKAQKERHAAIRKKHKNDATKKKSKRSKTSKKDTQLAVVKSQSKKYPNTIISHIS